MDFALFLLAIAGIAFMPDYPVFHDSTASASGNGASEPDEDQDVDLLADAAMGDDIPEEETLAQAPVDSDETSEPITDNDVDQTQPAIEAEPIVPGTQVVSSENDGEITPADIDGFEAGQDVLTVQLAPDALNGDLTVETLNSADGEDTLVFIGDELLAVLRASPNIGAHDVMVKIVTMAA